MPRVKSKLIVLVLFHILNIFILVESAQAGSAVLPRNILPGATGLPFHSAKEVPRRGDKCVQGRSCAGGGWQNPDIHLLQRWQHALNRVSSAPAARPSGTFQNTPVHAAPAFSEADFIACDKGEMPSETEGAPCPPVLRAGVTGWTGRILDVSFDRQARLYLSVAVSPGLVLRGPYIPAPARNETATSGFERSDGEAGRAIVFSGQFPQAASRCHSTAGQAPDNGLTGPCYPFRFSSIDFSVSVAGHATFAPGAPDREGSNRALLVAEENAFKDACVLIGRDKFRNAKQLINSMPLSDAKTNPVKIDEAQFAEVREYFLHYGVLVNQTCAQYATRLIRAMNHHE